jgi:hypothetical protein
LVDPAHPTNPPPESGVATIHPIRVQREREARETTDIMSVGDAQLHRKNVVMAKRIRLWNASSAFMWKLAKGSDRTFPNLSNTLG